MAARLLDDSRDNCADIPGLTELFARVGVYERFQTRCATQKVFHGRIVEVAA
jgi:hypothetical protein